MRVYKGGLLTLRVVRGLTPRVFEGVDIFLIPPLFRGAFSLFYFKKCRFFARLSDKIRKINDLYIKYITTFLLCVNTIKTHKKRRYKTRTKNSNSARLILYYSDMLSPHAPIYNTI